MGNNAKKDWLKKLSKLQNYDVAAKESEELGQSVPDGRYSAAVKSAEIANSKNGRLQINVKMEIQDDEEQEGNSCMAFMGLDEQSMKYTLATLRRLGFEITGDDPKELADIVEELSSSGIVVNVKITDGFSNILDLVDGGESDDDSDDEDDTPPKKKKSKKDEDEEEGEDEEDEDDSDEDDDEDSDENDEDESDEDSEDEDSENEDEEGDEESSGVVEGAKVSFKDQNGKKKIGEVIEIIEDKNLARIEQEDGKIIRIEIDDLTVLEAKKEDEEDEGDDDEDEDTPPAKSKKKTTQKPVVKKKTVKRK